MFYQTHRVTYTRLDRPCSRFVSYAVCHHARSMLLQVLTGKVPYHYYKNDAQVLVALSRGLRPARPYGPHIDDIHWEFTQRCWSSQSKRPTRNVRPSIEEVVDFLAVAKTRCS